MPPKIIRDLEGLRAEVSAWHAASARVAVVPTMGALHEGHLRLVREGLARASHVVATVFVNPKQFGPKEDLAKYPRDEEADIESLAHGGAHAIFIPSPQVMYPAGFSTTVHLNGPAKAGLEDKFRPNFFDGVATVVAKLFIQSAADFAMFGEKDYQQLRVVTQMAKDLDLKTEVIGVPTEREESGLAMSSRNRYLTKAERHQAAAIYKSLIQAAEKIRNGAKPQSATRAAARSLTTLGFNVDYVAARNSETLALPQEPSEPLRLLAAARLGATRLIDNIAV